MIYRKNQICNEYEICFRILLAPFLKLLFLFEKNNANAHHC